jgi:hypothetical protein
MTMGHVIGPMWLIYVECPFLRAVQYSLLSDGLTALNVFLSWWIDVLHWLFNLHTRSMLWWYIRWCHWFGLFWFVLCGICIFWGLLTILLPEGHIAFNLFSREINTTSWNPGKYIYSVANFWTHKMGYITHINTPENSPSMSFLVFLAPSGLGSSY